MLQVINTKYLIQGMGHCKKKNLYIRNETPNALSNINHCTDFSYFIAQNTDAIVFFQTLSF